MKTLLLQLLVLIVDLVQTSDGFSPIHSHLHSCRWASTTLSQPVRYSTMTVKAKARRAPQRDYFEEEDEDNREYESRESGGSQEEQDLRDIKYQDDLKRDDVPVAYYGKDDYDDQEDEFLEDEEVGEDSFGSDGGDIPQTGNFWSNPKGSLDPYPDASPAPRPRRRPMPPSTASPRRRPPKSRGSRTTFRSGTPASSDAFTEFYDRLFWYGMDEEDGDWVPKGYDKTVFGGTRGKFDALAYLEDGYDVRPPPRRIKRRLPPEDGSEDEFDAMEDSYKRPRGEDDVRRRQRAPPPRRRQRTRGFDFDDRSPNARRGGGDWVENEVSNWFDEDDEDEDEDYDSDYQEQSRRPSRRRRSRQSSGNPITQFLDGILEVDRSDMKSKEELYEQNLGRRPRPREQPSRRRTDYAYTFDEDDSSVDGFGDVIDINNEESTDRLLQDDIIVDVEIEPEKEQEEEAPKPRMSWEERSRRLERVPPAGIPAWGPSGDLGIDARTKAMLDGMEELREARTLVEEKAERRSFSRENIVILRADAALETKKRLSNPRRARERLRQIQLEVEDAARDLRRAQKEEEFALLRLEILQDKHWAVLSVYDADKASQVVDETLSEFSQQEPAARIGETVNEGTNAGQKPTSEASKKEDN